jgi:hypothetical protein
MQLLLIHLILLSPFTVSFELSVNFIIYKAFLLLVNDHHLCTSPALHNQMPHLPSSASQESQVCLPQASSSSSVPPQHFSNIYFQLWVTVPPFFLTPYGNIHHVKCSHCSNWFYTTVWVCVAVAVTRLPWDFTLLYSLCISVLVTFNLKLL